MKKIKFPQFKKDIRAFLFSEEAKITKKKALKMGMGLIIASGILTAGLASAAHTNYFSNASPSIKVAEAQTCSHTSHGSHGVHSSHGSHDSHGSHGQW